MKFGLNLNEAKLLPEEKLMETVEWLKEKDPFLYDNIIENRKDCMDMAYPEFFSFYLENYEYENGYGRGYGLAALIAYLVEEHEGIELAADDGIVGLEDDFPWNFNEKVLSMSREAFLEMLCGYAYRFVESPVTADLFD